MRRKTGNRFVVLFYRIWYSIIAIIRSDKIILNNVGRPSVPNRVNLHWWDSSIEINGDVPSNLGDNLSEVVVEYMLKRKGLSLDTPIKKMKHLYAIGSILSMGFQNTTVWGSGFLVEMKGIRKLISSWPFRRFDIRAVRGKKTRQMLLKMGHQCPEIYGDPAIIMPLIVNVTSHVKDLDYIIVPHFTKEKEYITMYGESTVLSMVTDDYEGWIGKMVRAKKVISSSLHGIILAESFGVPAIWLRDREALKDFKYEDYYGSTNRDKFFYANTVEEAIEMTPMELPKNIKELQQGLLNSFPYDLWNN